MVTEETLRALALSFPDTVEQPHFEKTSFRTKKKIFATYAALDKRVCLKLSEIDQSVFCSFDKSIVYPVPNKWGKQGWTLFELTLIEKEMLADALATAYKEVTKKK
ncbi:MmcQ/YjbR family DNA-binding protein [Emticicia agri]|uniref:MmcQ/YjbR family DNA-binding protein n=1 Tax=Emticicia agri TaxID=2492393 RepID=A0A4Q5LT94_9BACT|nr:MmcQ/YjbR family DNA-binding protein [Emticicia agri]RYU92838.1 MmcQ/YjbR family DNA-binding protein [Emticicia agri]